MGRIPEGELERLKREVSLQRLAEARGVELRRVGKDLRGCCPFHSPDEDPSLSIDPERNVFHCFGCGAKGSVVDWVMKVEGVTFPHAVEILRADYPGLAQGPADRPPPRRSIAPKLPVVVEPDADDSELRTRVALYYHETFKRHPEPAEYLRSRGLESAEMVDRFKLGYSNRTLGYHIPRKEWRNGKTIRGRLQELGIIKESGHELLRGSLTIPIFDGHGQVVQIYGRKIRDDLRKGTPDHLYLPGPRRGVFNLETLAASKEIILCEALIDALTFWAHGFRNVTSSFGVNGFTEEHLEALKAYAVERVLIAYDRDDAGEKAAAALAERLIAEGVECFRVQLPHGMDVNEYALKVQPAARSLELVIRSARWLGKGRPPARPDRLLDAPAHAGEQGTAEVVAEALETLAPEMVVAAPEACAASGSPESSQPPEAASPLVAAAAATPPAPAAPTPPPPTTSHQRPATAASPPATPLPSAPKLDIPTEVSGGEVVVTLGDRRYRVRGLAKNLAYDVLKVNLLVASGERFHVDTLNLYSARQRAIFSSQAAAELEVKEEVIRKDLGKVLLKLEELQDELIRKALEPKDTAVHLTEQEKAAALAFLQDPDLLDRISRDFSTCGLVGEHTNKLVGYLAAVSRKLDRPLAVLVQSSSAAGKSALMEAVLAFVPEEERVHYSAMTGQSLFYMGETDLKHKVLAIAEEEGAERASYALKLLQSEGELSIASTGKDPSTGRLVTHEYHVEGPAAILLTTTAIDLDEELQNRCLVLAVDESREQTEAIHRRQRLAHTLKGLEQRYERSELLALHRNAQRLLRPLEVDNPFAESLTFLSDTTRTRRDHEKYLILIDAVAILHQHQREVRSRVVRGRRVEYVEATLEDIAVANRLASEAIGRTLDELPPQTRRLLFLVEVMVKAECQRRGIEQKAFRFSRRDIRQQTGWGNTQLKIHLHRLEDMEYLLVHRGGRGQSFVYELLYSGEGRDGSPFVLGLINADRLGQQPAASGYDSDRSGRAADRSGEAEQRSGSSRPQVGGVSGGGRGHSTPPATRDTSDFEQEPSQTSHHPPPAKPRSYVDPPGRSPVALTAKGRG